MSVCQSVSVYLRISFSIYLCISVSIHLCISVSIYLCVYLPQYISVYLSQYFSVYICFNISLCIPASIYLCVYLPQYISVGLYLSQYLLTRLFFCLSSNPISPYISSSLSSGSSSISHLPISLSPHSHLTLAPTSRFLPRPTNFSVSPLHRKSPRPL